MELLIEEGFGDLVNFLYIPVNFNEGCNFGYGFVNLETYEDAQRCREKLQGFSRWPVEWDKCCEVSNGDTCQGVEEHIERYRNSPVMHESISDENRPALFQRGVRLPFPKPTKNIKKPQSRARKNKKGEGEEAREGDEQEDEP